MKKLILKYKQAWVFLYALIYFPWFLYLEHSITDNFHVIHSPIDDMIPFCEYFIIPYILWFAYMAAGMAFFLFKRPKEEFYKLTFFLFVGMSICLFICTIYPNGHTMRPEIDFDKNIFTKLVSFIYSADTNTNILPSIHVYGTIGVHIAVSRSEAFIKHPAVKIISAILALFICLSTVFLKQHSCVDGFAAMILAAFMYVLVYVPNPVTARAQSAINIAD